MQRIRPSIKELENLDFDDDDDNDDKYNQPAFPSSTTPNLIKSTPPAISTSRPALNSSSTTSKPKSRFALERERKAKEAAEAKAQQEGKTPSQEEEQDEDCPRLVGEVIERQGALESVIPPSQPSLPPSSAGFPSSFSLPKSSPSFNPPPPSFSSSSTRPTPKAFRVGDFPAPSTAAQQGMVNESLPSMLAAIGRENDRLVRGMSEQEIMREQQEIRESMGLSDGVLKMLEGRARKKREEQERAQTAREEEQNRKVQMIPRQQSTPAPTPAPRSVPTTTTAPPPEEGSLEDIRTRFFPNEPLSNPNLDWMRDPAPSSSSSIPAPPSGNSASPTFGLDGRLLSSAQSSVNETPTGSHHHASSASQFTFASLRSLVGSSVSSQRSTALLVVLRILSLSHNEKLFSEKEWLDLRIQWTTISCHEVKDPNLGVASHSVSLLAYLVTTESESHSYQQPQLKVKHQQVEGAEEPASVLSSIISSNPLPGFVRHLAPSSTSSSKEIVMILTNLITLASNSKRARSNGQLYDVIAGIVNTKDLLESVSRRFVAVAWPPSSPSTTNSTSSPLESVPTPHVPAINLLNLLSRYSRNTAQQIWDRTLVEPTIRFLTVLPWELSPTGGSHSLSRQLLEATLDLWTVLGKYGIGTGLRTLAADPLAVLALCDSPRGEEAVDEKVARLLSVWMTAGVDPHATGHDITWSHVKEWGQVGMSVHSRLVGLVDANEEARRRRLRLLSAAWDLLTEWVKGTKVNGQEDETTQLLEVRARLGDDFALPEGKGCKIVRASLDGISQCRSDQQSVPLVSFEGEEELLSAVVLSIIRLSNALFDAANPSLSTPLVTLDQAEVTSTVDRLLSLPSPTAIIRNTMLALLPYLAPELRRSASFVVLVRLGAGDEVQARDLLTWILTALDERGTRSTTNKTSVLRPFVLHTIASHGGARPPAPLYPDPADIKMTKVQAPFLKAGPLLPCNWSFLAVDELLRSSSSPVFKTLGEDWDGSETNIVLAALNVVAELRRHARREVRPSPGTTLYDLIKVFMLEKDNVTTSTVGAEGEVFRDPAVQDVMSTLLSDFASAGHEQLVRRDSRKEVDTLEGVSDQVSSAPFYQLYSDLVGLYDSISLSDPLFARIILPPLAMAYPHDYRRLVWADYNHILPTIQLTLDQIATDHNDDPTSKAGTISSFLFPAETHPVLLGAQAEALSSGKITKEKNPFLHLVAVHHTAVAIFGLDRSTSLLDRALVKRLAATFVNRGPILETLLSYEQNFVEGEKLIVPPKCFGGRVREERRALIASLIKA
ncbi:hypothetical protein T439DRAFT_344975 [Meredithblackwellia eburnea MCA 4105]